jgi:formylglycine-generating enzyme required for sulfatase activity
MNNYPHDGFETLPTDIMLGKTIANKFLIQGFLGSGGMGKVYRAYWSALESHVAIKILLEEFVSDEKVFDRFKSEAKVLLSIEHPNVVRIYDYGEASQDNAPAYIVMQFLDGRSLREILSRDARLPLQRVMALMAGICAGVGAAHSEDIVHRDLKPENVIVIRQNVGAETPKVLDFSIAKLRNVKITQEGVQIGTPAYMSPEQWDGNPDKIDKRTDVYSLGVMLYEMLTGGLPFEGRTNIARRGQHLYEKPKSIHRSFNIPPAVERVIMRALDKERNNRQADATEFASELNSAMLEPLQARAPLTVRRWTVLIGLLALLVALGGVAWLAGRHSSLTSSTLKSYQFQTVELKPDGTVKAQRKGQAQYFSEDLDNGVSLDMVSIPAGTFLMGSPDSEKGRYPDESPQRQVSVPSFFMSKYEITQAQWRAVASLPKSQLELKPEPGEFKGDNYPVNFVSWNDAVEFCARLSKAKGKTYRLPTEAEWEYACRAGTTTPFAFGMTITQNIVNQHGETSYTKGMDDPGVGIVPVGQKGFANGFGLFDMHGNLQEWCLDMRHQNYNNAPSDSREWIVGGEAQFRILRGGGWGTAADHCRCAFRDRAPQGNSSNIFGFRVVMVPGSEGK